MNLTIQYRKTKDLIPYARNSRSHSDEQVLQIASSIKEFGFTNPVLIDNEGGIIAGHGRVMAAKKLNINEVPTIELMGLSEAQKKAYIIADNKLALNSGWDSELLRLEFDELKELDFDLEITGFSFDEINTLDFEGDETEMPDLASGDNEPFQKKTFTLHNDQVNIVEDAVIKAKLNPLIDIGINENSNGNALAFICKEWLKNNE